MSEEEVYRSAPRDPALSRARIIAALAATPGLSRKDLAERLQIGRGTVTEQVRRLIQAGIITELPADIQGAGRPRVPLVIDPGAGYTLGIDLQPNRVVVLATSLSGDLIQTGTAPFDPAASNRAEQLAATITEWLSLPGQTHCAAIGIALSGVVRNSEVLVSVVLDWHRENIGEELERRTGRKIWIANDMEALATWEDLHLQREPDEDFLIVTVGAGVGMAIVRNDKASRAIGGAASEFGHVSVDPSGPRCGCGNHGCVETYVGTPSLLRRIIEANPGTNPSNLTEALQLPHAHDVVTDCAYRLGRAIGGAATLTSTSRVLLTGETMALWKPFMAEIRQGVDATTQTLTTPYELTWIPWSETSVATGAAALALTRTLTDDIPTT